MNEAKILIVEDESIIAMETERSLKNLGYEIISIVDNGEKAVRIAGLEKPDFILMDICLKGEMDGIEAANRIRSNSDIPLIFLTAFAEEEKLAQAKMTLPLGYLLKPVQERDLKAAIEIALYVAKVDKERRQAVDALLEKSHRLGERVKELNCFYGISELVEKPGITLEEILKGALDLIQSAWQYPETTCARLISDNQVFSTHNFRESDWKLAAKISVEGRDFGWLEVFYLEEKPQADEGPFLKEERSLINAICERLGKIIERINIHNALKESEARYRSLTENLPDIIVRFDKEQRHVFVSSNICEFFGGRVEDYIGKTHHELGYSIEQVELWTEKVKNVLDTGQPQEIEFHNSNQIGRRFFNCRLNPETDNQGNIEYALGIIRDVTGGKTAQEKLEMQEEKLHQADKMISLGVLVSGVAHEINNPNYAISSHISPLKKIWDDVIPILDEYKTQYGQFKLANIDYSIVRKEISDIFSTMSENSRRIKNIVEELKQFTQKRPERNIEAMDFNRIVQSALTLCKSMINKSTNHFSFNSHTDLPSIKGHYQQLEQVVVNLIQNACQSLSDAIQSIYVSTHYDNSKGTVVLKITDEGTGIETELLPRITDPFFTTKRDIGGIGLGLSISSKIVMDHGGTMTFTPGLERGTTVTVSFPK